MHPNKKALKKSREGNPKALFIFKLFIKSICKYQFAKSKILIPVLLIRN